MQQGYWLNNDSRKYLSNGYLSEGQTAEERIREIAEAAEKILKIEGYADKFEQYMLNGWISLASPIWSNFGNDKGLPISCNGSFVDDSIESILYTTAEVGTMTKKGAGTSVYYGKLRPRGTKITSGGTADGPVHYMELLSSTTNIVSQGNVRRGHAAVWLDIEHADIKEFLTLREEGSPIQNMSVGVCVSDAWMIDMIKGDSVKRKLWAKILQKRSESGYPYIFYTDNVNNNKPSWYKDYIIWASNMCTEIALPSNLLESFVCCLASLNLLHVDEWMGTDLVKVVTYFLDAVMEEYIQKTEGIMFMERANRFARRHRAVGLGVLGWHSFLQSRMIAFESDEAREYNVSIRQWMFEQAKEASREMAVLYGEPEVLIGTGYRNATNLATAPTTSSSFILGQVSPGDEPLNSNYFTKDLQKGKFAYKNPHLVTLLKKYDKNNKETWNSILINGGSVQQLDFLTDHEKEVFKTFGEISQSEIIIQAAARQPFIDQAQSLNLMIHPNAPVKDVNALMIQAWELGIKTLYYQRSTNPAQEFARELLQCKSCAL